MDKNISILIYEKEKHLNSILYQQISYTSNYEPYSVSEHANLLELVEEKKFDICVLNIDDLNPISTNFFDKLLDTNRHANIIGYYKELINNRIINDMNITLLVKPFKFRTLLEKLEYIKLTKNKRNKIILINHIEFLPDKKILFNPKTKITIHLTEKENYLLNYLYSKQNLELTKNDLLSNIWGVTERINTHTLETHIYRLKQKLFKVEPNLSFSFINKNGLYSIKNHQNF